LRRKAFPLSGFLTPASYDNPFPPGSQENNRNQFVPSALAWAKQTGINGRRKTAGSLASDGFGQFWVAKKDAINSCEIRRIGASSRFVRQASANLC